MRLENWSTFRYAGELWKILETAVVWMGTAAAAVEVCCVDAMLHGQARIKQRQNDSLVLIVRAPGYKYGTNKIYRLCI